MTRLLAAAALLFPMLCRGAGMLAIEDISPHLPSNALVVWQAATNHLPLSFWTYEKASQKFSAAAVSNALALGGFQLKPFPKSLAKPITIWDKEIEGDPRPDYLLVSPEFGITCRRQRHPVGKGDTNALVERTWQYAQRLGIDKSLLAQKENSEGGWTVSLCRKIDGIPFWDATQGFSVQYGAHGEILSFVLMWPELQRQRQEDVASPDSIINCIHASKTPVIPKEDEPDYFARIKTLATVKKLTISRITPYYVEGRYGEQTNDREPMKFVEPVTALDVVADWGNSNATFQLFAPLLKTDVERLIKGNPIPKAARDVLENADEFTLLSLKSNVMAKGKERFCEYAILGKKQIKNVSERRAILDALYAGVSASGPIAECFNPRHGIRAKRGNETEELLICFDCGQIHLHGAAEASLCVDKTPAAVFNRSLTKAHVPISK
jgi:hypothetical protein